MKKHFLSAFLPLLLAAQQLVVNPDFAQVNQQGKPVGWGYTGNVQIVKGPDGQSIAVLKDMQNSSLQQNLVIKPEYGRLELDFWMKTTDVVQGVNSWQTARLAMAFYDKDNKQVGGWPEVFGWCGTTDWTHCVRTYTVPIGATRLSFSASLFGISGTAEFKNITFTVTRRRVMEPANALCPVDAAQAQSLEGAWKQTTPTRETVSLNGLWQFRPLLNDATADKVPGPNDCWGWYKLPAIWPTRWTMQGAYQTPIIAQYLEDHDTQMAMEESTQAWYKRTVTTPATWQDRQIALDFTLVNTYAKVFVDGVPAGEVWFPGGEVDLTGKLIPGRQQTIAILVKAIPLSADNNAFMAPDRIIENKAVVKSKGLNGDVYLHARPRKQKIDFVHVITSVRNHEITFKTELTEKSTENYRVKADVTLPNGSFKSFQSNVLKLDSQNTLHFTAPWTDAPLWDIDSPTLLTAKVSLLAADGQTLIDQATPFTFGFREFRADGKDLLLNEIPIHLRALHCDAGSSPTTECASEAEAVEMISRMRQYGFNFLINGHYNFSYGQMTYLDGLLNAGQKTGYLMSFSLPHVNAFQWELHKPEVHARYTAMAKFLIRKVANNPAVVMYALNHNATGYFGDQNPMKIDGKYQYEPDDTDWSKPLPNHRRLQAKCSELIAKFLDPTRLVYHHESGNLGDLHCINIYLNWAPMQERSDWMRHWFETGVKPVFFVEWGLPHISTWSSFRGPQFIWRFNAFQSLWAVEDAAAEFGEEAYRQGELFGQKAIDHEENLWAKGTPFPWSSLCHVARNYPFYHQLMSKYSVDNWRAHRTFGVSAMLPWDQGEFWKHLHSSQLPEYKNDLTNLKHPGLVPDRYSHHSGQFIYDKGSQTDWEPTAVGKAFLRYNMPTCAYIGGPQKDFTEKSHVYNAGETIHKSLVLINDTRKPRTVNYEYTWMQKTVRANTTVNPGTVSFIPLDLPIPNGPQGLPTVLHAKATFDNDDTWEDSFPFQVQFPILPSAQPYWWQVQIYDPKGLSTKYLSNLPVKLTQLTPDSRPDLNQLVVIGREALSENVPLPWLSTVISQGRLLVFEQTYETLTSKLGFRANIHGLRELFPTPAAPFISADLLSNWRGKSTLTTPYLEDLPVRETHDPQWKWLDFTNTRVWRCENRGNVADVLIEKPTVGNWRPLVVGGFDLQYAPLLETVVNQGRTIFCQLDVTGRTDRDPAADEIVKHLFNYLQNAPAPASSKPVFYVGGAEGGALLKQLGVKAMPYASQNLSQSILVCAHGASPQVLAALKTPSFANVSILYLGLDKQELELAGFKPGKDDSAYSSALPAGKLPAALDGLTSADFYWHAKLPVATLDTANTVNDHGHLALPALNIVQTQERTVVCQQAAPWMFDYDAKPYLRHSYRRAAFATARLLANLGAELHNPLLDILSRPSAITVPIPLAEGWKCLEDPQKTGRNNQWFAPDFNDSQWPAIETGKAVEDQRPALADYNGYFWFRLKFNTPKGDFLAKPILDLGACDDESWVWLNGKFLGEITQQTNPDDYWSAPRKYTLEPDMLRQDGQPNTLAVLVNDTYLKGGIMGQPRISVPGLWTMSYYLQAPVASDDPYRYYRW